VYNSEAFLIVFYCKRKCNEKNIFSENNTKNSYVHECQMKGFLHNVESLQTYLIQYANQNLFENEKKFNFFKCLQKNIHI